MKWSDPAIQEFMSRSGFEALSNYPLYSTKAVAAAAWSDKQFFQESSGSATNGLLDTNMLAASQMAHPERFLVTSINLRYMAAVATNKDQETIATAATYADTAAFIMENTVLKFSVNGGNEVLTVPTGMFPAGSDLTGQLSTGGITANGWQMVTNAFPFLYPLESKVNFLIEILKPSTTFTPTVATRVQVVLNGIRFRSKQR
jgi:hypothetical protein